jgi:hypothetical protein
VGANGAIGAPSVSGAVTTNGLGAPSGTTNSAPPAARSAAVSASSAIPAPTRAPRPWAGASRVAPPARGAAAAGSSQDCGVRCWVDAETAPAGASDRENLERQIAFQEAAIQAIALTGRFSEVPAGRYRPHQLEAELQGLPWRSRSRRS